MSWWVADMLQQNPFMLACWIFWVLFSITLHELGHGVAAIREGDDTPIVLRRMRFDPITHMGMFSLIAFAVVGIAWGAMPVNPLRFKHRRFGEALVAAAGPAVNLVLGTLAMICYTVWATYFHSESAFSVNFELFLKVGGFLNFALLLLNLLPIPPLDGGVIMCALSSRIRQLLSSPEVQSYAIFGFIALIWFAGGIDYIFQGGNLLAGLVVQAVSAVLPS